METLLAFLLTLTPAPKETPPFFVGRWDAVWGGGQQRMEFRADGGYETCRFGGGNWWYDPDGGGGVIFDERATRWVMYVDPETMTGTVESVSRLTGKISRCPISLKLRPGAWTGPTPLPAKPVDTLATPPRAWPPLFPPLLP